MSHDDSSNPFLPPMTPIATANPFLPAAAKKAVPAAVDESQDHPAALPLVEVKTDLDALIAKIRQLADANVNIPQGSFFGTLIRSFIEKYRLGHYLRVEEPLKQHVANLVELAEKCLQGQIHVTALEEQRMKLQQYLEDQRWVEKARGAEWSAFTREQQARRREADARFIEAESREAEAKRKIKRSLED